MKVLLIVKDLFSSIGGGQTVYRKIVESTPDVDFYYFVSNNNHGKTIEKPKNAHEIALKERRRLQVLGTTMFPTYKMEALVNADQYAFSVRNMEFDIVDIPDYETFGQYLKSTFRHNMVEVGRFVLAMHGSISTSIKLNWDTAGQAIGEIEDLEYQQFKQADLVYAISDMYKEEWCAKCEREVRLISPLPFVNYKRNLYKSREGRPSLYCIGRTERRKGNDIFLELLRWIGVDYYEKAAHIGSVYTFQNGVPSSYHLENLAKHRNLEVAYYDAFTQEELKKLYNEKSFVIIPSRYDSLNLVALEALFSGCPVAVSTTCGVCKYLDSYFPGIPYIKIDFDKIADAIHEIKVVLDDYDNYRRRLYDALDKVDLSAAADLDMAKLYREALDTRENPVETDIAYRRREDLIIDKIKFIAHKAGIKHPRKYKNRIKHSFYSRIKKICKIEDARVFGEIVASHNLPRAYKAIAYMPENTTTEIKNKLERLYSLCDKNTFRCTVYLEIARLLRKLGQNAVAATYELRVYRLSKVVPSYLLAKTVSTLRECNYTEQAEVADILYTERDNRNQLIYEYLKKKYVDLLENPCGDDNEYVEDYRKGNADITILVSLYNAASKLDHFISLLMESYAIQDGTAEVIFIDSNSPLDEYSVIKKYINKFNLCYIKSKNRETIQKAWNRGLRHTQSKYITFLGVDEMIYPNALNVLAGYLDSHPETDWVMGNSIVTNVEKNGLFNNDIMVYDRTDAFNESCILETCYLTYVAGLYRSNVHQKFGFFDEHYKGAGDTEIKCRLMPHIETAYLPLTLGYYLNYPEERVTASTMAEIEDLQAWYLFRTYGGVKYVFESREISEIEKILISCLGYRKSYTQHISTDFEYASLLVKYLLERDPENQLANSLKDGIEQVLKDMVALEYIDHKPKRNDGAKLLKKAFFDEKKYLKQFSSIIEKQIALPGEIYTDNRYEQHSWLWKPEIDNDGELYFDN